MNENLIAKAREYADYHSDPDDTPTSRLLEALADALETPPVVDKAEFAARFVQSMAGCRREYVSVHEDDQTFSTVGALSEAAYDVLEEMFQEGRF